MSDEVHICEINARLKHSNSTHVSIDAEDAEKSSIGQPAPVEYGPGTAEPLPAKTKFALVGIAAVVGCILVALSFMIGDNGTRNDANNRGPSGVAQNRADPTPTPTAQVPEKR